MKAGQRRDQLPVELFRERGQGRSGPQPGLDVDHRYPQVKRSQGRRHRRRRVAVDQHRHRILAGRDPFAVGLVAVGAELFAAEVIQPADHLANAIVQLIAGPADPELVVGLDAGQREDLVDHAMVLAGRDDDRTQDFALPESEDHRDQLDRLRARTDDDQDACTLLSHCVTVSLQVVLSLCSPRSNHSPARTHVKTREPRSYKAGPSGRGSAAPDRAQTCSSEGSGPARPRLRAGQAVCGPSGPGSRA